MAARRSYRQPWMIYLYTITFISVHLACLVSIGRATFINSLSIYRSSTLLRVSIARHNLLKIMYTIFLIHAKHGIVALIADARACITHFHFKMAWLVATIQLRYPKAKTTMNRRCNNISINESQLDRNQCLNGIDAMKLNVRLSVCNMNRLSAVRSNNRIKQANWLYCLRCR